MKHFTAMTAEELVEHGFRLWSDDNVYLIPGRLYDQIPNGTQVISISGSVHVKGPDSDKPTVDGSPNPNYIDRDTRGGLLAYGIVPKKERT